ncbi:MAG: spermidine synthase [Planctomycetota bacterium]
MLAAYTVAVCAGAALVFLVQPLIAKQLLPRLGGSPAVWNACMVFFQAALLAGYGYAHAVRRIRSPRAAAGVHLLFLLLPLGFLPLLLPADAHPGPQVWPPLWALSVLALSVGLPFVAVSTTSPLLQHWFSRSGHEHAGDPYFLYAASNVGSIAGLLSYPFLLEPLLGVPEQARVWSGGYLVFLALVAVCGGLLWRSAGPATGGPEAGAPEAGGEAPSEPEAPPALSGWTRLRWVLLAFAPSSLTLGVTQHLSTDLAAIPLLWVIPLTIYLLSFVVAFSARPAAKQAVRIAGLALPVALLALALVFLTESADPLYLIVSLHLAGFAVCAVACHGWLAELRPPPARLTEFFLWTALGGVLGGSLNALVAPVLFSGLWEYSLVLVLVAWLRPDHALGFQPAAPAPAEDAQAEGEAPTGLLAALSRERVPAREVPAAASWLAAPTLAAVWVVVDRVAGQMHIGESAVVRLVQSLVPLVGCYLLSRRRGPFTLALGLLLALPIVLPRGVHIYGERILSERTFFGVHTVWENAAGRWLVHGNTIHGIQQRDSPRVPLAYYNATGPAGDVFTLVARDRRAERVGLVGLGVGTMAAYGKPGRRFTYFEIDEAVVRIAREQFHYLRDSQAEIDVVLGDGRLQLAEQPDGTFGLLVLDAFSSDAIPTHLITREALELYLRKLQPHGLILFHISNRYLDLRPVLGNLARDLELVARGRYHRDEELSVEDKKAGILASNWVVLGRAPEDLGGLLALPSWTPVEPDPRLRTWTDDYSNVLSVMSWE